MKKPYVKPAIRSRAIRPGDMDAGARFAQKRSVPRYPFAAPTVILEPLARTELSSTTSDISLRGCFVKAVDRFPTNTVIRIKIERYGEIFETWGRVAHVQKGIGTGIAFFEHPAEACLTIQSWIAERIEFFERAGGR
jgi:PilZ domain